MRTLNIKETRVISGGYSGWTSTYGVFQITVTDNGSFTWGMPINGYNINLKFYPDHVTDLKGNTIFTGTTGSFTFNEFSFVVSPTKGGAIYNLTSPAELLYK